jgi:hypothetical protein
MILVLARNSVRLETVLADNVVCVARLGAVLVDSCVSAMRIASYMFFSVSYTVYN